MHVDIYVYMHSNLHLRLSLLVKTAGVVEGLAELAPSIIFGPPMEHI